MLSKHTDATLHSVPTPPERSVERRRTDRNMTLLRVGSLMVCGRQELCLIRNISESGMMIRAYSEIPVGTSVSIELKQGESVRGTTQWAKRDLVGVRFEKPINMMSLIATAPNSLRPRMPRIEVQCAAWVRDGAFVHRVRLVNISQGGVRIAGFTDLPFGAQVTVGLPSLPREQGVVRWIAGESCGIAFNSLLPLPKLVAWIGAQHDGNASRRTTFGSFPPTSGAPEATSSVG